MLVAFHMIESGLTMRSYTIVELDDHTIMLYFNPDKIIGKMRKGRNDKKARKVEQYYVMYIHEHAIRFNWLDVLIHKFLQVLKKEVEALAKQTPKDWRTNAEEHNINFNGAQVSAALNLQSFTEYVENEEMRYELRRKRYSEEMHTRETMKEEIKRQKEKEKQRLLELKKLKELLTD